MPLAITVAVTILAICTWSTTVGALIPLAAQRFGIDPAVLSAPLITTLVDATGLVIYFQIAKAVLGL
jgi:magnesium transporter